MHAEPITKKNHPLELNPPVQPMMPWRITQVQALGDYRLKVRFVDGLEGYVDMHGLVHSQSAGVFAALSQKNIFSQVFLEHGAVTWPGEIDLAPDAMHKEIAMHGEWVLC